MRGEGSPEAASMDTAGGNGAMWLHLLLSARVAAGPGLLRNFPREGQTTLLSPWGGNGAGYASPRKPTSKERIGEKRGWVPFPGLAFGWLLVPSAACGSLHSSGGRGGSRGAALLSLPMMPGATWSEAVWLGRRLLRLTPHPGLLRLPGAAQVPLGTWCSCPQTTQISNSNCH